MEDLLEPALLFRIGENYGAECAPIQISCRRKNLGPKLLAQEGAHFRVFLHERVRGAIGVAKAGAGPRLKKVAKGGFPGGEAPGDPVDCATLGQWDRSSARRSSGRASH